MASIFLSVFIACFFSGYVSSAFINLRPEILETTRPDRENALHLSEETTSRPRGSSVFGGNEAIPDASVDSFGNVKVKRPVNVFISIKHGESGKAVTSTEAVPESLTHPWAMGTSSGSEVTGSGTLGTTQETAGALPETTTGTDETVETTQESSTALLETSTETATTEPVPASTTLLPLNTGGLDTAAGANRIATSLPETSETAETTASSSTSLLPAVANTDGLDLVTGANRMATSLPETAGTSDTSTTLTQETTTDLPGITESGGMPGTDTTTGANQEVTTGNPEMTATGSLHVSGGNMSIETSRPGFSNVAASDVSDPEASSEAEMIHDVPVLEELSDTEVPQVDKTEGSSKVNKTEGSTKVNKTEGSSKVSKTGASKGKFVGAASGKKPGNTKMSDKKESSESNEEDGSDGNVEEEGETASGSSGKKCAIKCAKVTVPQGVRVADPTLQQSSGSAPVFLPGGGTPVGVPGGLPAMIPANIPAVAPGDAAVVDPYLMTDGLDFGDDGFNGSPFAVPPGTFGFPFGLRIPGMYGGFPRGYGRWKREVSRKGGLDGFRGTVKNFGNDGLYFCRRVCE